MRMSAYVIAAALCAGLPGAALAQSAPPAAVPSTAPAPIAGTTQSHWVATGFVGSNWGGNTATDASATFGGQVAWLWRGVFGGEGIADFAPSFDINNIILTENPRTNAFMGNAIFALPLGGEGQWQPYVSGGLGTIGLKVTAFNALLLPGGTLLTGTSTNDEYKFGTDVGGGLMGFHGIIGFRADVRWFKASNNITTQTTAIGLLNDSLLTGIDFWRANLGISVRW
ncbi:MAG TPA: hypothetical protein VLV86_25315 [Vicinamibacterales bacterium]|nr:hypothetical protein [Vicinamibacterales bacterium]